MQGMLDGVFEMVAGCGCFLFLFALTFVLAWIFAWSWVVVVSIIGGLFGVVVLFFLAVVIADWGRGR